MTLPLGLRSDRLLLPGRPSLRQGRVSQALVHWRASDATLTPLTGQTPTFARPAVGGAVKDVHEADTVMPHSAPRWMLVDLDGDGTREVMVLAIDPPGVQTEPDLFSLELPALTPRAASLYVELIETSLSGVAGAIIALWGDLATAGFGIRGTGTGFEAFHVVSGVEVTSAIVSAPAVGARVEFVATLAATGAVQLVTRVNGAAAVTSGVSGALALAAAWGAEELWLGSEGVGNEMGSLRLRRVKLAAGVKTLTQMLELF